MSLFDSRPSFEVTGDEPGELEHRNRPFSVKDGLEPGVGVDLGPDLGVLKFVLFDVVAKLPGHFDPWHWLVSRNSSQNIIRLDGFEKCSIRFGPASFSWVSLKLYFSIILPVTSDCCAEINN